MESLPNELLHMILVDRMCLRPLRITSPYRRGIVVAATYEYLYRPERHHQLATHIAVKIDFAMIAWVCRAWRNLVLDVWDRHNIVSVYSVQLCNGLDFRTFTLFDIGTRWLMYLCGECFYFGYVDLMGRVLNPHPFHSRDIITSSETLGTVNGAHPEILLEVLKHYAVGDSSWLHSIVTCLIRCGDLATVQKMMMPSKYDPEDPMMLENNSVDMTPTKVFAEAMVHGHTHIMDWIYTNFNIDMPSIICIMDRPHIHMMAQQGRDNSMLYMLRVWPHLTFMALARYVVDFDHAGRTNGVSAVRRTAVLCDVVPGGSLKMLRMVKWMLDFIACHCGDNIGSLVARDIYMKVPGDLLHFIRTGEDRGNVLLSDAPIVYGHINLCMLGHCDLEFLRWFYRWFQLPPKSFVDTLLAAAVECDDVGKLDWIVNNVQPIVSGKNYIRLWDYAVHHASVAMLDYLDRIIPIDPDKRVDTVREVITETLVKYPYIRADVAHSVLRWIDTHWLTIDGVMTENWCPATFMTDDNRSMLIRRRNYPLLEWLMDRFPGVSYDDHLLEYAIQKNDIPACDIILAARMKEGPRDVMSNWILVEKNFPFKEIHEQTSKWMAANGIRLLSNVSPMEF